MGAQGNQEWVFRNESDIKLSQSLPNCTHLCDLKMSTFERSVMNLENKRESTREAVKTRGNHYLGPPGEGPDTALSC